MQESYTRAPRPSTPKNTAPVGATPKDTAIRMLAFGLWPVPLYPPPRKDGKQPIGNKWGLNRNTADTIYAAFEGKPKAGIGVALGPGRGPSGTWLIDVEGDGPEAEESRVKLYAGLVVETLAWGSARGGHQLLTADVARIAKLLPALAGFEVKGTPSPGVYHLPQFPSLEIRFGGFKEDGAVKQVQSAFPPTVGTDGKPRQWNGVAEIAEAPESLYEALKGAAVVPEPVAKPEPSAPAKSRSGGKPTDLELASEALRALPASYCDDYFQWFKVGCSLRKLGSDGLDLWDQWSRGSTKYQDGACREKWGTIGEQGINFGSLIAWAKEAGWVNPNERNRHKANGDGHPPTEPIANGQAEQPREPSLNHRLAQRPRTDLGNAERLVARHGPDLKFCHPWKKWVAWDGTRFRVDNTAEVRRRARRTTRDVFAEAKTVDDDEKRKAHVLWGLKSESRDRLAALVSIAEAEAGIPILPEELDRRPWLLNCRNGTLDLKTGHLREHRREDLITQLCPVRYDGNAECQLWLATLDKVFAGNLDLIGFWQRLCGCVLTGTSTEQMLPILHGTGSNGKSTLLNVLLKMLGGDYAMKAMPDLLMVKRNETHPTDKADLFGKRLVVAIETEEGARINEALIKELTGSDPIRARRMREDPWQFDPTHKVMLCTNHKPSVRGTDHAMWRRLKLIPFGVKIPDDQADKDMPAKLLGEMPGILAWCVRGCLDWQEAGLMPPSEVTAATEEYRKDEDILGAFLDENCTINPSLRAKATPLYERYRKWAEAAGENPVNQRKFGKAMNERGFTRVVNNGTWYDGIGLRSDDAGTD